MSKLFNISEPWFPQLEDGDDDDDEEEEADSGHHSDNTQVLFTSLHAPGLGNMLV